MSQKNYELSYKEADIIEKNEKYFSFLSVFPIIVTIILAPSFFIAGIVCAIVFNGIFLIIMWLVGAVFCLIYFFLLRVSLSSTILSVSYLRIIALDSLKIDISKLNSEGDYVGNVIAQTSPSSTVSQTHTTNVSTEITKPTPTTSSQTDITTKKPSGWTCKKCGFKNSSTSLYCRSCGEYK